MLQLSCCSWCFCKCWDLLSIMASSTFPCSMLRPRLVFLFYNFIQVYKTCYCSVLGKWSKSTHRRSATLPAILWGQICWRATFEYSTRTWALSIVDTLSQLWFYAAVILSLSEGVLLSATTNWLSTPAIHQTKYALADVRKGQLSCYIFCGFESINAEGPESWSKHIAGCKASNGTVLYISSVWPEPSSSAAGVRTAALIDALQSHDWAIFYLRFLFLGLSLSITFKAPVSCKHVESNRHRLYRLWMMGKGSNPISLQHFQAEWAHRSLAEPGMQSSLLLPKQGGCLCRGFGACKTSNLYLWQVCCSL